MGYAKHQIILNESGTPCDYIFTEINDTFERITGLTKAQVLNNRVTEVIPAIKDDPFNWIGFYGNIATGGEAQHFEQFSTPLGKWYQIHAYSDEPDFFITLFLDASRQKIQKQRQQQAEAHLNAVLDSTLDSIWSINRKYEIQYINATFQREFEKTFGVKLECNSNLLSSLPPELQSAWKARYDRGLAGERFTEEDRVTLNGTYIHIEFSANPIYENGIITGVSFFSRNVTEKRNAERALKENSERLNSILNNLDDVVWSVMLPDYRIHFLSPKAEQLYGYPIEAFYQNPDLWRETVHPEDLHTLDESFETLFDKGFSSREARVIRPDGSVIWILDKSTLIRDENGKPIRIDGIASNITNRKLLEAERDDAALKLQEFSKHLPGVLFIYQLNPDGTHTFPFVSEGLMEYYGVTHEEAARDAEAVLKAIHPADAAHFRDSVAESARTLSGWQCTFRVITPDNKIIWTEGNATPEQKEDGTIVWFGFSYDVNERKVAEYELERFKKIADKAVYGEAIADLNGRFIYTNRFFADIHGYAANELEGGYMSLCHTPEQLQHVSELISKLTQNGTFEPTLVWHKHRDGSTFPMLMSGVLLHDDEGKPAYMAATAIDITQQYQAEKLLSDAQKQLTNISDNLPDGLVYQILTNPDSSSRRFTYISAGVELMHGLSAKEVLADANTLYGQMLPEDGAKLKAMEEEAINKMSVFQCEYRIKHPNGGIRWFYASSSPRLQPNGDILWDGIEIDITEKKKAEEELVRLSQAVEQSPASVVITDVAGNITYVNPTFTELTGYSLEEALGQNPRILKSGNQPQSFYKELWDTITSGRTWKGELLNHKKNGESYWESATISPIKNDKGEITSYLAVKENITERKRADEALQKSEEKYRIVADNTYHWEFWELPTGELIYNSPACERVTGYTAAEFTANPELLIDILHPEDRAHYKNHRAKTWNMPEPDRCEFRLFHKNGTLRFIEHVCQPVFDKDGTFRGVRGTNLDVTSRKHIETKLKESEKRFREIFEKMPVISVQGYNRDREVIYWNEASEKLYGYTRAEALGNKLDELIIPSEGREQVFRDISNWIDNNEPIPSAELRMQKKNGTPVYVYSNHVLIYNMQGEAELYCIDIDLTELKEKERNLRLSEARYRSIIQVSRTGAWEYNFETDELWCSPEYFKMLGYTGTEFKADEFNFSLWESLVHPDDLQSARTIARNYIEGGMIGTYESYFRMIHKDGHSVWVWSRGQNLPSATGSSSNIILGVHIDITEIREAENKLRDSELYHRSLLQTIADLVFVLDKEGTFLDFKAPQDADLYMPPESIIGANVNDSFPKEVAEKQMLHTRLALSSGKLQSFEYELNIKGKPRYYNAVTTAFGSNRVITTVRNITDYKDKLDEIKSLLDIEEKQSKRLRDFTHIVSHNLRIHTANILGIFMMLEMEEPELYKLQYLQMLKESAENLDETITHLNKVLDMRQIQELNPEIIELREFVNKAFGSVNQIAERSKVRLINEVEKETIIKTVPPYLFTILLNLLTNGIKFRSSSDKTFVKVSAMKKAKHMYIYVEDNGLGIDMDRHKHKLFGMYKKFHNDRGSKGMGLFITKNQVEALGGEITVESELNKGTTFIIILPYEKNQGSLPH
ncbi:PAS domain S-box protein [Cyclonatronum proteinivorum]|nr:PAS domain S-box protein [Cyclonatronum proteinivorum]